MTRYKHAVTKNKIFLEKKCFKNEFVQPKAIKNVNFGKGGGGSKATDCFFPKRKELKFTSVGICWIYFTNYYLVGI